MGVVVVVVVAAAAAVAVVVAVRAERLDYVDFVCLTGGSNWSHFEMVGCGDVVLFAVWVILIEMAGIDGWVWGQSHLKRYDGPWWASLREEV